MDPTGYHQSHCRSVQDDPDSGAYGGDDQPADPDFQTATSGTGQGAAAGGDRQTDGYTGGEGERSDEDLSGSGVAGDTYWGGGGQPSG